MPLPETSIPWPPPHLARARDLWDEWGAWYRGDREELATYYRARHGAGMPAPRPSQYRGGIVGAVARMWWGTPPSPGQAPARLHIPIPADLAATSADLLWGEPPEITLDTERTRARWAEIVDEGDLITRLHEAGELAAAYGGAYLRIGWDTEIAGVPLVDAIRPDCAVPEWRFGRLSAVTFWRQLDGDDDGREVWRHLERHEGGRIEHGLYRGTAERLGRRVDLGAHPETAPLAALVGAEGAIDTGARATAFYWPNLRPNKGIFGRHGEPFGRSDYAGIEPLFDALDETWSSWMRDIRLGKGRLVVPRAFLESAGPGRGASFDAEAEIWAAVDALPPPEGGMQITPVQFQLRVEEHSRTAAELRAAIITGAGYSTGTFGEAEAGEAITATQVRARQARTYITRGRKIRYARPPLAALVEALLAVDQTVFGGRAEVERPTIEWPDGIADDPETTARTIQLLDAAGAISTYLKVRMQHPEWTEAEIAEEVDRIRQDEAASAPVDPFRSLDRLAGVEPEENAAAEEDAAAEPPPA